MVFSLKLCDWTTSAKWLSLTSDVVQLFSVPVLAQSSLEGRLIQIVVVL